MQNNENNATTYQVKPGYIHRKVAGSDVLISVGGNVADFNGYIELNAAAANLWDWMKEPCTAEQLSEKLENTFGIDHAQAEADVWDFLKELQEHDMVVVQ